MKRLRVFLADDHPVVRAGLRTLINADPELEVVGEAAEGQAAIDGALELAPDVIVMDVSMPGVGGAKATSILKDATSAVKVLALTVHEERSYVRMLLDAGARGYILKRTAAAELIQAIKVVADGRVYLDPTVAAHLLALRGRSSSPTSAADLLESRIDDAEPSQREIEVLKFIALGYSNKQIADKLDISVKSIETYKKRAAAKLGLRNRVDIVRYAMGKGWTNSD